MISWLWSSYAHIAKTSHLFRRTNSLVVVVFLHSHFGYIFKLLSAACVIVDPVHIELSGVSVLSIMASAESEPEVPGVDYSRIGGNKRYRTDEESTASPSACGIQAQIQVLRNRLAELGEEKALHLGNLSRAIGIRHEPCEKPIPARFGFGVFYGDGHCEELKGDLFAAISNFLSEISSIIAKPTGYGCLEDRNTCPPYNDFQATCLNDHAFTRRQHRRSRTQRRPGHRKNKVSRQRQSCLLAGGNVGQSRSSCV